jgi:hypothetical protein
MKLYEQKVQEVNDLRQKLETLSNAQKFIDFYEKNEDPDLITTVREKIKNIDLKNGNKEKGKK